MAYSNIELGTKKDINEIEDLYNSLNDYLKNHINYPGWIKDIYPVRKTAEDGIYKRTLYVMRIEDQIAGTVILNHEPESGYSKANWNIELDYKAIFVVYTFALHPLYLKKGFGKKLMDFVIEHSRNMKMKAIRLDVFSKNLPAISLYKKYGFEYIDTIDLGYSEYGLDNFELYQKIL